MTALVRLAAAACLLLSLSTAVIGDTGESSDAAGFQVFLIGNSHSSGNKLPELLASVIRAGIPGAEAHAEDGEGLRIYRLHQGIAGREPACVAPVGLAWEIVRRQDGSIRLHAHDGNHSNRAGALLTAFVLYRAVTGRLAATLPRIDSVRVKGEVQDRLKQAADEAWSEIPQDRRHCPPPPVAPVGDATPIPFLVAHPDRGVFTLSVWRYPVPLL